MHKTVPFGLAILSLLGASFAGAQAPPDRAQKAAADVLFDEAKRLMQEKKFGEACLKFEETNRLDPGVGILLYLADCYKQAGRTTSAWTTFREAAGTARNAGQLDREKLANRLAAELEPTLVKLLLEIPNKDQEPGLTLKRNGVVVGRLLWGAALPVDPGPQVIEASAEGKTPWTSTVEVSKPGQTVTVRIPVLEALPPPPVASSAPPPPPSPPPVTSAVATAELTPAPEASPPGARRTLALVAGGVGLLGVGVGSYLGLRTFSLWDESRNDCQGNRCATDTSYDAATQARRSGNLSTLFFSVGAVGLGAGALLWFSAPSNPQTAVAPVLSPQGGGLSIRRSW